MRRLGRYAEQLRDGRRVAWRTLQFGVLDELAEALRSGPPVDLVHANSLEAAVLARVVADDLDVPLVATIHEHAPEQQPFGAGRLRLGFRRLGLDAVGTSPERCLHVGDSVRNDVNAARSAGAQVLHFAPYTRCAGSGHADVASLTALADWLLP